MATYKNHVVLSSVEDNGDVNEFYPITDASDVSIEKTNSNIPSDVNNFQQLLDNMSGNAFGLIDDAVINGGDVKTVKDPVTTEINDDYGKYGSPTKLLSSTQIKNYINDHSFMIKKSTIGYDYFNAIDCTRDTQAIYCINTIGFKDSEVPSITVNGKETPLKGKYIVEWLPCYIDTLLGFQNQGIQRWIYIDEDGFTDERIFTRVYKNNKWSEFYNFNYK